jgi:phosphonate metabolism transcriptional regulator PhnF
MYRQGDVIERSQGVACYLQISRHIQEQIDAGLLLPGNRLPAEHDLGRQFGVNRHTAREALKKLRHDGLIYSIKGKGSYVADSKIRYRVSQHVQYSRAITEAGLIPATRLISVTGQTALGRVAQRLALREGEPVTVLEMLRFANATPFILATSILPTHRFPGLASHLNGSFSLYAVLREKYGVEPIRSESVFEAIMPGERECRELMIPQQVPLLMVTSLARDRDGAPVEHVTTAMRGDIGSTQVIFDSTGEPGDG